MFVAARALSTPGGCLRLARFDRAGAATLAARNGGNCVYAPPFVAGFVASQPLVFYADNRSGSNDVWVWR